MLEAKAKDQEYNAQVFSKKKVFVLKNRKISQKFMHSQKKKIFIKFQQSFWRAPTRNTKMVITLAYFQQIKK